MLAIAGVPKSGSNPVIDWQIAAPDTLEGLAGDLRGIATRKAAREAMPLALRRLGRCTVLYTVESTKGPKTRREHAKLDELVSLVFFLEGERRSGKGFLQRVSSPDGLKITVTKGLYLKDVVERYRTLRPRTVPG